MRHDHSKSDDYSYTNSITSFSILIDGKGGRIELGRVKIIALVLDALRTIVTTEIGNRWKHWQGKCNKDAWK